MVSVLEKLVTRSFDLLELFINNNSLKPTNEAQFQFYFSHLLINNSVLFNNNTERINVYVEHTVSGIGKTCKNPNGTAICDIVLERIDLNTSSVVETAYVELKYLGINKTCSTDNRFSVLKDIEVLEHYYNSPKLGKTTCFLVVYAESSNYTTSNRSHKYTICNNQLTQLSYTYKKKIISLKQQYTFKWKKKLLLLKV